jgi:hypothetical protein
MAPNRNYESLVAGMRERPTIFDAEDVLRKDYKVRFPDRRAITLWNTPEISQFRGVQEAHDDMEERVHNAQLEQMELRRAANRSETSMPDMEFVAAEVMRSRQSEGALRDAMASQAAAHAQQLRGMQEETMAQMTRLATEAATAAKRAEIADRALEGLRDLHAEHRAALGQIAERMGRPAPVSIDQSVTNYTQNVTAVDERSIHNIAMQAVNAGAAQFGAAMAQNRQSQEQMMQSLLDYAATHQAQHNHVHFYNIGTPPNEPEEMQVSSSSSGPPPPPGAGAIRRGRARTRQTPYDDAPMPPRPPPPPPPDPPALPAPAPAPAPTAPAAIVRYSAPKRERTRSAPRTRARPTAAPEVPTPLLPAPEPAVPKPSMAGVLQIEDSAAPSAAPARPSRARAKPSARPIKPSTARPSPAPIMWTTGPMSEEALPPKRPRTGGIGKGRGSAAPKAAPKSKGRGGRVNAAAVAAAVGKDEEKPAVPKPKSAPRRNKVPAAGPPVKKTIVKKVPLDEGDMDGTLKKRRNKA